MWACESCTFVNDGSEGGVQCGVCETPRAVAAALGVGGKRPRAPAFTPPPPSRRLEASDDDDYDDDESWGMDVDEDEDAYALASAAPPPPKRPALAVPTGSLAAESEADARIDATLAKAFAGGGSALATKRLMQEFKDLIKLSQKGQLNGIEVSMPDDANGYHWIAELTPPLGGRFHRELEAYAVANNRKPVVELEILFDANFPYSPPFIRVVRPRFAPLSGHITSGGSICVELLTASGWSSAYTMESVLVQLNALMDAGGARLDRWSANRPYGMREAKEAFRRVASDHGWKV